MSDVTEVKQEVTKTQNAVALLDTGIEAVNTAVTEALSDMKCTQEGRNTFTRLSTYSRCL